MSMASMTMFTTRSATAWANCSTRPEPGRALMAAGLVIVLLVMVAGGATYMYLRKYVIPPDFSGAGTG